jgi:hypothetical protein
MSVETKVCEHRRRPQGAEERNEPGVDQSSRETKVSEHRKRPQGAEERNEPEVDQ